MENLKTKAKELLTRLEYEYFCLMNGRAGTLYIEGPPGGGKSAILRSIAKKLNLWYYPIDAPSTEETDLGLYPSPISLDGQRYVEMLPPKWAYDLQNLNNTTYDGALIPVEEMNRNVRLMNALLCILNERRIANIYFDDCPKPIFLAATGNLGAEDGTQVEEMDNAQLGRLLRKRHVIDGEAGRVEWEAGYAGVVSEKYPNGRVIPQIREYLKKIPADIRPKMGNNDEVVLDSRRWSYLSDAIMNNYSTTPTHEEVSSFVSQMGSVYIGARAIDFLKFLNETKRYTVEDVLSGKATKPERDNAGDLANNLVVLDYSKVTKTQLKNIINFVKTFDHEMQVSFIQNIFNQTVMGKLGANTKVDDAVQLAQKDPHIQALLKEFEKEIKYLLDRV